MIYESSSGGIRENREESTSNRIDLYVSIEQIPSDNKTIKHRAYSSSLDENEEVSLAGKWTDLLKTILEDGEKKKDQIVNRLRIELLAVYKNGLISNDLDEEVEKKIIQIEYNYSMRLLGEVLQSIVYRNYNNEELLISIGNALLRYTYNEVDPWGMALIMYFINHPSDEVKNCAVQLIDNWNNVEMLPLLDNIEIHSQWLTNYVAEVVRNMKKCITLENSQA